MNGSTAAIQLGEYGDRGRSGRASIVLLGTMSIVALVAMFAIEKTRFLLLRLELQNSVDACALAAVQDLVSDSRLLGDSAAVPPLLDSSLATAVQYGVLNPANGQTLLIQQGAPGHYGDDVVFGSFDFTNREFLPLNAAPGAVELLNVNAVRVIGEQSRSRGTLPGRDSFGYLHVPTPDVAAGCIAALDDRISGFRPVSGRAVPLVPLAILSDLPGSNPISWQYQVRPDVGIDNWEFVPGTSAHFESGSDGLPEVTLVCGENAVPLAIGSSALADFLRQCSDGVAVGDLALSGGELLSGAEVPIQGSISTTSGDPDLATVLADLRDSAQPRIWPLYRVTGAAAGHVIVVNFVAARVVSVDAGNATTPVSFLLQPCMVHEPTSIVAGAVIAEHNPYIRKGRMVY